MRFRAQRQGRSRHVRLFGELDASSSDELRSVLEPLADTQGDIELDCSELTFMDSSGLHVLLGAARDLGSEGLVLVQNPTSMVRRLMSLTGVERCGGIVVVADEPPD